MSKKRVTRSSSHISHENLLEYEFCEKLENQANEKELIQAFQDEQKPKQIISKSRTSSMKIERKMNSQVQPNLKQEQEQSQLSNSMASKSLKLKKKKTTKFQQNEGIRIIQEKQTQRMFQYLCTPEGIINVESLGRIMVRAKKQFEIQDLQNMIAYFDTIREKMKRESDQGPKPKKLNRKLEPKEEYIPSQRAGKRNKSLNKSFDNQDSNSMSQISQSDSESNFEDNLDQDQSMEINPEQNYKTELNFEQFKLLKKYFDKE